MGWLRDAPNRSWQSHEPTSGSRAGDQIPKERIPGTRAAISGPRHSRRSPDIRASSQASAIGPRTAFLVAGVRACRGTTSSEIAACRSGPPASRAVGPGPCRPAGGGTPGFRSRNQPPRPTSPRRFGPTSACPDFAAKSRIARKKVFADPLRGSHHRRQFCFSSC